MITDTVTPLEDLVTLAEDDGKAVGAALPRRRSKRRYHDMDDLAVPTELPGEQSPNTQ